VIVVTASLATVTDELVTIRQQICSQPHVVGVMRQISRTEHTA
jgi:hypothetical protein